MAGELPESSVQPEGSNNPNRQRVIKLELGDQTGEVGLVSVNHLFADVHRYNDQFSMGSMMVRLLFSRIKFEDEGDAQTSRSPNQEAADQQLTASTLGAIHQQTLGKLGLSLEPVAGKNATIMHEGEAVGAGEMRINIQDGTRFTSFLHALEPQQVEDTGLKSDLEGLSGVLAQQVLDHYDLKEPGDEALQLFGGLGRMVEEYKRLGMGQAVERLETYLEHSRQGDLREYVAIERGGLLSEPGKSFGPADWQKDATPEYLERRWGEAIGVLIMTKDNPRAQSLYEQLKGHLIECAKIARADASSISYYTPEARERLQRVLDATNNRLEDVTSA